MPKGSEEQGAQPSMLARAEEIQQQIQQLSGRDLQLWSIGILVILVLTAGILAVLLPNLVWPFPAFADGTTGTSRSRIQTRKCAPKVSRPLGRRCATPSVMALPRCCSCRRW